MLCKGISRLRELIYITGTDAANIDPETDKWIDPPNLELLDICMQLIKELGKGSTGIESATLSRLPGSTVEAELKLDKINPFPMVEYLLGHLPKPPPGYIKKKPDDEDGSTKTPLSADEETQLKAAFDKVDKDKSGKIDLKELKGMLEELGAKVDEYELEEGMNELDTNSDGTCCFDEFKKWWQSKPAMGYYGSGYRSFALKFLKQKMKVSSMLDRVKSGLGGASGYIGLADNPDETYIKFQQELTPGMIECPVKMGLAVKLENSTKKVTAEGGKYSPELVVQFNAKSDSDAKDVAEKFKLLYSSEAIAPMYAMMGVPLPESIAEGSTVILKLAPPSEMVGSVYESDAAEAFQVLTVLVKSAVGSGITSYLANDFNDLLSAPDAGIYTAFSGCKAEGVVYCTCAGKALALDAINGLAPMTGLDFERNVGLPVEIAKLFQSLDLTYLLGYHKDNVEKAAKYMEEMAQMTSPNALRTMMASMTPPFEMFPPEMLQEAKKMTKTLEGICDKLDSLTSITVDGLYLPGNDSGVEEHMVAVTASFTNYKPFDYLKYMTEPLRAKLDAA
jgi:hypothetical protein